MLLRKKLNERIHNLKNHSMILMILFSICCLFLTQIACACEPWQEIIELSELQAHPQPNLEKLAELNGKTQPSSKTKDHHKYHTQNTKTQTALTASNLNQNANSKHSRSTEDEITCIDLNTASQEALETLPRVGPKTAYRIIAYRKRYAFKRKRDIKRIKGIGRKTYAKIWLKCRKI